MGDSRNLEDARESTHPAATESNGLVSLIRRLGNSPGALRREVHSSAYWNFVMKEAFGEVEKLYQVQYYAEIHHSKRLKVFVGYFRDFPESAGHSSWAEGEVMKLWRMGDTDSLGALRKIIEWREQPRPLRVRMKQAMRGARFALFPEAYRKLKEQYGAIKQWIKKERNESYGIKRKELWDRWQRSAPSSQRPPIDMDHFFKLASTSSKHRYYTPAYVARSYLAKVLNLPDRMVSRPRSQPTLAGLRINLLELSSTVTG